MKNWKKVMAMLCTAAMITGFSAPVWAEADAAEETEAAEATEITELTIDMLEEAAYEGTWLTFEPGFDLYVQVTGMFWKFPRKTRRTGLCSRHWIRSLRMASIWQ